MSFVTPTLLELTKARVVIVEAGMKFSGYIGHDHDVGGASSSMAGITTGAVHVLELADGELTHE